MELLPALSRTSVTRAARQGMGVRKEDQLIFGERRVPASFIDIDKNVKRGQQKAHMQLTNEGTAEEEAEQNKPRTILEEEPPTTATTPRRDTRFIGLQSVSAATTTIAASVTPGKPSSAISDNG